MIPAVSVCQSVDGVSRAVRVYGCIVNLPVFVYVCLVALLSIMTTTQSGWRRTVCRGARHTQLLTKDEFLDESRIATHYHTVHGRVPLRLYIFITTRSEVTYASEADYSRIS